MKFKTLLTILLLALLGTMNAQAAQDDEDAALRLKIHNAVMGVYNKYLEKDPNDYNTLFQRASQLYNMGYLVDAKADIDRAIELTPAKDKDLRCDELVLRALINDDAGDLQAELEDLKQAIELNPQSMPTVGLLARLSYKLGDLDAAKKNYEILLRKNARNYQAMYGLALVEAKRGNNADAIAQVDRAVELYPATTEVYLNRADILEKTGNYENAVNNYLLAMTTSDDNGQAIQELFNMSDYHYDDVMKALRNAADKAPGTGLFQRIRSSIAIKHAHYGQALKDLESLIDNNLMSHAAVQADAARCALEVCEYDKAAQHAAKAIEQDNADPDYYITLSRALQGKGDLKGAAEALAGAEKIGEPGMHLLLAQARLLIAQKKDAEAVKIVNKAIELDGGNAEALMLRGWLNKYRLNQAAAANVDFETVLLGKTTMRGLRGFALHELGRDDEARMWATDIINDNPLPGGEAYFVAAALMSDMDDNAQGMRYMESALANGYGSRYEALVNEAPYVNLKLLRRHPDYETLVSRYASNFEIK